MQITRISLARAMIYKANFLSQVLIEIGWSSVTLVSIELIFTNITTMVGWDKGELLFIYSIYRFSQAIYAIFFRKGIRELPSAVNLGNLDQILTKPVNSVFLIVTKYVALDRFSQIIIAFLILLYAQANHPFIWSPLNVSLYCLFCLLGAFIRFSLAFSIHLPVFWIQKLANLERLEITFFGFSRYPRKVFPPFFQAIFSFFLPVLFTAAIPAEILTSRTPLYWTVLVILVTLVLFIFSLKFFNFALRHYSSASS